MTFPVDSTDAREQREAEQERAQDEITERERHARECRDGWRGEDAAGHPIPCVVCRPHLLAMDCTTCGVDWNACRSQSNARRGPCCDRCLHLHRGDVQ